MEETQEGEVALRFDTFAIVDQLSNILPHILQLSTLSTDNFRQFKTILFIEF